MGFGTWFWTVTDFIPIVGTVARGLQAAGCAAVGDIHCSVEAGKNMAINLTADVVTPLLGPAARAAGFAAKTAGRGALRLGENLLTRTIVKTGTEIAAKAGGEAITKAAAETAAKKAGKAAAKNSTFGKEVWNAVKPRPIDLLGGVAVKGATESYHAIRGALQGDKESPDDDDVPSFVDDDDDWVASMYWGDNPLNNKPDVPSFVDDDDDWIASMYWGDKLEDNGSHEPEDDGSRRLVAGTEDKKEPQINPGVDLSRNNYFIDDINLYNATRSLEHQSELADQVSNPAGQSSYDDTSILLLLTSLGFAYYIVSE